MNCSKSQSWIFVVLGCCLSGQASGQVTVSDVVRDAASGFEAADQSVSAGTVGQWDYRFDTQYQSTIKPYLRWYMRYDPRLPGNRVLPRDYGQGGYVEYGTYTPNDSGGWTQPSIYWNHLRYLHKVYGGTPIIRPEQRRRVRQGSLYRFGDENDTPGQPNEPSSYDEDPDNLLNTRTTGKKSVWIARNQSGTYSILYEAPPSGQAARFSKAIATLGRGARIQHLEWAQKPNWYSGVQLVNGRLKSRL